MHKMLITFIFSLLLSCSEAETDEVAVAGNQERDVQFRFSTRLNNQLMISGHVCEGHESVWFKDEQYFCSQGQWLVVVDNVNRCNSDGVCTDVAVEPSIMNLTTSHHSGLFVLAPFSPLRGDQRYWVEYVWVRYFSGQGEVIWR